ncbi:MAG TPA: hypothetical protein VFA89_00345 [Terriglobales bacterium]|nr:hypothetical protein [Terriglobales bacterium]
MYDHLQFITHQGKRILLIDFSHCTQQQMLLMLEYVRVTIAQHARESLLTLADFTGAEVDRTVATKIKEVLTLDRPFVKKSAWVGTESLPKAYYDNFKIFSRRDFPTFATRQDAMNWLVA